MYTIKKNGVLIYTGTEKIEPKVELNVNGMSSLTFKDTDVRVYDENSYRTDTYTVYDDEQCIFSGRPTETESGYLGRTAVYCEGAYGYFNDTIVQPMQMPLIADVRDFVEYVIGSHNTQVATNRQIIIGEITVAKTIVRRYNYDRSIDAMRSLFDECGGYVIFTYTQEDGTPVFNWFEELPEQTGNQIVQLGVNILDFLKRTDVASLITAVIPTGPVIESTSDAAMVDDLHVLETDEEHKHLIGQNLTLTNRTQVYATDYIKTSLFDTVGAHFEHVSFQDATSSADLLVRAQRYMSSLIQQMIFYEVEACDIHFAHGYEDMNKIEFGKRIRVRSSIHGVDTLVPCVSMKINLDSVKKSIQLGTVKQKKLTDNLLKVSTTNNTTQNGLQKQIDDLKERKNEGGQPQPQFNYEVGGPNNQKGQIIVYNDQNEIIGYIDNRQYENQTSKIGFEKSPETFAGSYSLRDVNNKIAGFRVKAVPSGSSSYTTAFSAMGQTINGQATSTTNPYGESTAANANMFSLQIGSSNPNAIINITEFLSKIRSDNDFVSMGRFIINNATTSVPYEIYVDNAGNVKAREV